MPADKPTTTHTPRINQWVPITNFTPGIYNNSYIAGSNPVVPAPIGSADARYTFGCMGLSDGGLGPLPRFTTAYTYPIGNSGFTTFYTFGFINNPLNTSEVDQLMVMMESATTTSHLWQDIVFGVTGSHNTILTHNISTSAGQAYFGSPFPQATRITPKTPTHPTYPTTIPGKPLIVWPTSIPSVGTGTGQLWVWPNPHSPTAYTPLNLCTATHVTGQVVIYQGRILVLTGNDYTWGSSGFLVNEQICYTTPANSQTYGKQDIVLSPTYPYGYGAAGSISAGELFLVKKRAGALVLTGDINYPTVTFLPGVQPTGDIFCNGASTSAGFIYFSQSQGAWLWNGGNVSQKISQNLDDNFYACTDLPTGQNNLTANAYQWGEWVMCSNSWIYNLRLQSWWRLPHQSGTLGTIFWYSPGRTLNVLYCAPPKFQKVNTQTVFAYKLTKASPSHTYIWQSLPIKISNNKYINIREIVLYASSPQSTTGVINVKLFNGPTMIFTHTTTTGQFTPDPTMVRIPTGGVVLDNVVIRITATTTTHSAPILHSITIGCTVRQHVETS